MVAKYKDKGIDIFYINRVQLAKDIKALDPADFNKKNPSLTRETGVLNNVHKVAEKIADKSKKISFISVSKKIISKAINQNKPIFSGQTPLLCFKEKQDAVQSPQLNPKN